MTLIEQIDRRLIDLYFETGIRVVREQWLEGETCRLYLKFGEGIMYERRGECTTSDTKASTVKSTG